MKRAIITGATGFIGSWLALELLKHNYEIVLIVRNKKKLLSQIISSNNCMIIEKEIDDITKEDFDKKVVSYDMFFHLAWAGVDPTYKNDAHCQIKNILMSMSALNLCKTLNCNRFLVTGTVAEYVFSDGNIDVSSRESPNDIYGAAKVSVHHFLEVHARQLGQAFNWIIIPSTYGERREDNNILTYTIKELLRGNIPTYGNLEQMWDFLYVGEVVKAIRLIGEKGKTNKTYGIGSGEHNPLRYYIEKIRDIINPELKLEIGILKEMSQRTYSSCVDIQSLVNDTGFVPGISFEKGIRKAILYYKKELEKERNLNN